MPSTSMLRRFIGGVPGDHVWRFFRAGGLDQVRIENAADLVHLDQLDQKLWVALSCPVKNLEFDTRTLELIDIDRDGRVRVTEVVTAVKWASALLRDPAELIKGADGLPLASINDTTAEGKAVLASARQILKNLGKPEADTITAADTSDTVRIFAETRFNGDGVVPPAVAGDESTRTVIEEIMAIFGAENDRSGKPGITKAKADGFFTELKDYAAWWKTGEDASSAGTGVLPMGADTPAAYACYQAVKGKIIDYFQRCRLAAFDARALAHLNRAEAEFAILATRDLSTAGDEIAQLPLSHVAPGRAIDLTTGINPVWTERINAFRSAVVTPLLGAAVTTLSDEQWQELVGRFASYEAWVGAKKGVTVEKLGIARVREILASDAEAKIEELIKQDLGVAGEVSSIDNVDRLVRYYRDLYTLLRNFVNFADFYDPKRESVFQAGTLFLDQRSCDLCIRIDDAAAHANLGNLGKVYIAYCACSRPNGDKMTIAAAFTQGDADYLMVGRNGVFYDRKGRDWDATIVKALDHPISIKQAFWSPYKKIGKMISDMVEQIAGAADKAVLSRTSEQIEATSKAAQTGKPPERGPAKAMDMGMLAALGIVATGMAGAVAGIAAAILQQPWWSICLMPLGLMAVVSGPAMVIAWLKLRQRTLGPILEANGWAINGRVKINIPLGTAFTSVKALPPNAIRSIEDPFADPNSRRRKRRAIIIGVVLLLVIGRHGYVKGWFDGPINEIRVFLGIPGSDKDGKDKEAKDKAGKSAPPASEETKPVQPPPVPPVPAPPAAPAK